MLGASADDFWMPSLGPIERDGDAQKLTRTWTRTAISNWQATLSRRGPDATRQIVWRMAHGLLGAEFYDARWSPVYQRATTATRVLTPFLIVAASSLLLVAPARGDALRVKALGLLLLLLIVAQNLVIGSLPRYVLPLLPGLLLFGLCAAPPLRGTGGWRLLAAAVVFGLTLVALHQQRGVLAWEWGQIESAEVVIVQTLPRASLPRLAPATLHIRVAAPVLPTAAGLESEAADGRLLYSSRQDQSRERAELTIALPQDLLDDNQRSALSLRLRAFGDYDAFHYLLFPVVPPPWSAPARRIGNLELSPSTGVLSGALDWWAHAGAQ
jgi:hypothetical protein